MQRVHHKLPILIILSIFLGSGAQANTCLAPPRPYVPAEPEAAKEFSDIISQDFETYYSEVRIYIQCLDEERQRVFREAQEVGKEHRRFFDMTSEADEQD